MLKLSNKASLDRIIRVVIYITVFWAILALASTGQVALPMLLAFTGLVAYSAWENSLLRRIPSFVWTIITVLTIILAFVIAGYEFLFALLFMFFYLIINKLSNPMNSRDQIQVAGIAFFLCISSTVITESMLYAVFLIGYIILFTTMMILVTIRGDREEAHNTRCAFDSGDGKSRLFGGESMKTPPMKLLSYGLKVLFFVIPLGVFLFMILPRFTPQQLFSNMPGIRTDEQQTTGFTDEVRLGSMASIKKDRRVALRVQPTTWDGDTVRTSDIYMRGTSLDFYDGRTWHKSRDARKESNLVRTNKVTFGVTPKVEGKWIRQQIFMEPTAGPYVFAMNYPHSFEFSKPLQLYTDYESDSIRIAEKRDEKISYTAYSKIEEPASRKKIQSLDLASMLKPERFASLRKINKMYLQEPRGGFDKRISDLAAEITREASSNYEKASLIENYLINNFAYSLSFEERGVGSHLAEFLFDRKTGHCEFFASAMAALCRAAGIPARIVNGYYSTEWNDYGKYFIVRQQDAHSWVEVWLMDSGWISFDPTPPAGRERESSLIVIPAGVQKVYDTLKFNWYKYVIDYSFRDQVQLGRRFGIHPRSVFYGIQKMRYNFRSLFDSRISGSGGNFLKNLMIFVGGALLLITASGFLYSYLQKKLKLKKKAGKNGLGYRRKEITLEYEKILNRLNEAGFMRLPSETPVEFARSVAVKKDSLSDFLPLTRRYYALRFRDDPIVPGDRELFRSFVKSITKEKE